MTPSTCFLSTCTSAAQYQCVDCGWGACRHHTGFKGVKTDSGEIVPEPHCSICFWNKRRLRPVGEWEAPVGNE